MAVAARVGIHVGEVMLRENPPEDVARGAKPLEVEGLAKPTAARLMSLAEGGQTLLTRTAFDPARRASVGAGGEEGLCWLAHGPYRFKGVEEAVEVFEVGEAGRAPLAPPPGSEKAARVSANGQPIAATECWNVPFERNPFFTGRDDVLEELRDALTRKASRRRAVAISGLGGIGKTQTAVEYAYRYRQHYDAVFWVAAETADDLETGYAEIARRLDLPEHDARQRAATVRAVLRWLESNDSWLLILDNADHPEDLRGRLPAEHSGHVLLTSRARSFGRRGRPLRLPTLTPEQAEAFLLTRAQRAEVSEPEQEAVAELARELGYLPLALEQAAAYVEDTGTAFRTYLSGFRRRRLKLLGEETAPDEHSPVATTWEMNFDEIEKTSAASADLLRVCAFLAPDRIPEELIVAGAPELGSTLATALANAAEDELCLDELLRPLRRFSLIQRDVEARTLGIHRLVQEAVKVRMDEGTRRKWAQRVVAAVVRALPGGRFLDSRDWRCADRLFSQGRAAARLVDRWALESVEASLLLNQVGVCASYRTLYQEAERFIRRALVMRRRLPPAEHPRVVDSLLALARVLVDKGAYEEAETLCREVLALSRNREGVEVAESLARMGIGVLFSGAFKKAEHLLREALALIRREVGDEHPVAITSLSGLGLLSLNQGVSFGEGERFLRQATAVSRRLASIFRPTFQSALALMLALKGDRQEAETLGREALAAVRELDDGIPEAEHGDGNPAASSLHLLAEALDLSGSSEEAEQLYRETLAAHRRQLGEDHRLVAQAMSSLAKLLVCKGAYPEAERLCNRALAIRSDDEHPDRAHILNSLASLRLAQGRYIAAEELIRRRLKIQRRTLPAASSWIAFGEGSLGTALAGQGRHEEAEPLLVASVKSLRGKLGDRSPLTRQTLESLIELYEAWGKTEDAAEYRAQFQEPGSPPRG